MNQEIKEVSLLFQIQGGDIDQLMYKIRFLITKTIASVQPIMNHAFKSSRPSDEQLELCFEILGFDIMIDKYLKPWLIEINHTPSFQIDSDLDYLIKKNLLLDTFILLDIKSKEKKIYYNFKKSISTSQISKQIMFQCDRNPRKVEDFENLNLNGFMRCYPVYQDQDYMKQIQNFINGANQMWNLWSGPKKQLKSIDEDQNKDLQKDKKKKKKIKIKKEIKPKQDELQNSNKFINVSFKSDNAQIENINKFQSYNHNDFSNSIEQFFYQNQKDGKSLEYHEQHIIKNNNQDQNNSQLNVLQKIVLFPQIRNRSNIQSLNFDYKSIHLEKKQFKNQQNQINQSLNFDDKNFQLDIKYPQIMKNQQFFSQFKQNIQNQGYLQSQHKKVLQENLNIKQLYVNEQKNQIKQNSQQIKNYVLNNLSKKNKSPTQFRIIQLQQNKKKLLNVQGQKINNQQSINQKNKDFQFYQQNE